MKNEEKDNKGKAGRPQGSVKKKMNRVEVEDVIKLSLKEILNKHLSYTEYMKWACKNWGISQVQANEYWLRVWSVLKEKYQLEKYQLINKHLSAYWRIYDIAMSINDLSNARQTLNDISKLLGMSEPEKLDIKQELQIKFKFGGSNDEEIPTDNGDTNP